MSEILLPPKIHESEAANGTEKLILTQESIDVGIPNANAVFLKDDTRSFNLQGAEEQIGVVNKELDVDQSLVGILAANEANPIGLIRVTHNGEQSLALAKLSGDGQSDQRAELLGLVTRGSSMEIGRDGINPDDRTISSKHLEVSLDEQGEVVVNDHSMNGSVLIEFEQKQKKPERIGPKGLMRFLKKQKSDTPESDTSWYAQLEVSRFLEDNNAWAPPPKTIAEAYAWLREPSYGSEEAKWDYTQTPDKLIELNQELKDYEEPSVDENGAEVPARYKGRPVIKRDSPVNGGVYIVPGIQEAIVVNDGTKPRDGEQVNEKLSVNESYQRAYRAFVTKARAKGVEADHVIKTSQTRETMEAALESVKEQLRYDIGIAIEAEQEFPDKKMNLNWFMEQKKGVCRHQALLAAYFIEKAINGGYMRGSASVDRNRIPGKGGHAWMRYTSAEGQVFIVDPAQDFVGTLEESRQAAEWDYSRPEDKQK